MKRSRSYVRYRRTAAETSPRRDCAMIPWSIAPPPFHVQLATFQDNMPTSSGRSGSRNRRFCSLPYLRTVAAHASIVRGFGCTYAHVRTTLNRLILRCPIRVSSRLIVIGAATAGCGAMSAARLRGCVSRRTGAYPASSNRSRGRRCSPKVRRSSASDRRSGPSLWSTRKPRPLRMSPPHPCKAHVEFPRERSDSLGRDPCIPGCILRRHPAGAVFRRSSTALAGGGGDRGQSCRTPTPRGRSARSS